MAYFLIAVSNRQNLDLCTRYGLAGFTSSASGLWTFLDINEGDFVSFIYGARVFNLYEIERKTAYLNADNLPPWPSVTFKPSGRTYYFPFRAQLRPIRVFNEQLVRAEFAYVGENLLLRGGYRKTHFQADQTTLQAASEMGGLWDGSLERLDLGDPPSFTPLLTVEKSMVRVPETFQFKELFLQAMLRRHLASPDNMKATLDGTGLAIADPRTLEILSEKAFPEGHVDLLVKEATPMGFSKKVVLEVKTGSATKSDIDQIRSYRTTLGDECVGAVLVARAFSRRTLEIAYREQIVAFEYALDFPDQPASFPDLLKRFRMVRR